eukprot:9377-Heterococcus_DN1.PRE.3
MSPLRQQAQYISSYERPCTVGSLVAERASSSKVYYSTQDDSSTTLWFNAVAYAEQALIATQHTLLYANYCVSVYVRRTTNTLATHTFDSSRRMRVCMALLLTSSVSLCSTITSSTTVSPSGSVLTVASSSFLPAAEDSRADSAAAAALMAALERTSEDVCEDLFTSRTGRSRGFLHASATSTVSHCCCA